MTMTSRAYHVPVMAATLLALALGFPSVHATTRSRATASSPHLLMAVVDGTSINFLTMAHCSTAAVPECVVMLRLSESQTASARAHLDTC